mmetsp:Transcript_2742/g.8628  ORF Transcript_2742/g.8628 Transcript_2742/m.8628 type:complete len:250 (+) Transcript_2742:281-1030(+)
MVPPVVRLRRRGGRGRRGVGVGEVAGKVWELGGGLDDVVVGVVGAAASIPGALFARVVDGSEAVVADARALAADPGEVGPDIADEEHVSHGLVVGHRAHVGDGGRGRGGGGEAASKDGEVRDNVVLHDELVGGQVLAGWKDELVDHGEEGHLEADDEVVESRPRGVLGAMREAAVYDAERAEQGDERILPETEKHHRLDGEELEERLGSLQRLARQGGVVEVDQVVEGEGDRRVVDYHDPEVARGVRQV